ncbi:hypothetical protein GCM10010304_73140 [Streptomyces roseoviolaceus]
MRKWARFGGPLCLYSSEAWGSGFVEGAVAEHRERTPPEPEALSAPGSEDTGGRGLLLVAALATRWGWHLRPGGLGKTVWAEWVFATPT